jgi:hypothetical protein
MGGERLPIGEIPMTNDQWPMTGLSLLGRFGGMRFFGGGGA